MIFPGNFLNAFGFFNVVDNYLSVFDPAFLLSSYFAVKLGTSGFINLLPTWCLIQFRYLIQDPVILIKAKDFRFQSVPNKKKKYVIFFITRDTNFLYDFFQGNISANSAKFFLYEYRLTRCKKHFWVPQISSTAPKNGDGALSCGDYGQLCRILFTFLM